MASTKQGSRAWAAFVLAAVVPWGACGGGTGPQDGGTDADGEEGVHDAIPDPEPDADAPSEPDEDVLQPPEHCGVREPLRLLSTDLLDRTAIVFAADRVLLRVWGEDAENVLHATGPCGEDPRELGTGFAAVYVLEDDTVMGAVDDCTTYQVLDADGAEAPRTVFENAVCMRPILSAEGVLMVTDPVEREAHGTLVLLPDPQDPASVPRDVASSADPGGLFLLPDGVTLLVRTAHPQRTGLPAQLLRIDLSSGATTVLAEEVLRVIPSPDLSHVAWEHVSDELHLLDPVTGSDTVFGVSDGYYLSPPFYEIYWTLDGRHMVELTDMGYFVNQMWEPGTGRLLEPPVNGTTVLFNDGSLGFIAHTSPETLPMLQRWDPISDAVTELFPAIPSEPFLEDLGEGVASVFAEDGSTAEGALWYASFEGGGPVQVLDAAGRDYVRFEPSQILTVIEREQHTYPTGPSSSTTRVVGRMAAADTESGAMVPLDEQVLTNVYDPLVHEGAAYYIVCDEAGDRSGVWTVGLP